jgi:hypothetical protein
MAIQLPPSDDVNALAHAIHEATTSGEPLVLLPGVHLTKPGHQLTTPIGPKGLVLSGKPRRSPLLPGTTVQRPEFSVGDNPQHLTDENYGLYFIPCHPSDPEIASLPFRVHPPIPKVIDEPFEFAILQRGDVKIGGFDLDCNMGKQKLKPKKAPHSFMLGFSGASYDVGKGSSNLQRRVFIALNSVTVRNITLLNGGFADDIRLAPGFDPNPPGYFRPNIALVDIAGITTGKRVKGSGGNSIRFDGLAQRVKIKNCDVDSLILEFDPDWSTFLGPPGPFEPSRWDVSNIQARAIAFNATGPVQTLRATNLDAQSSFAIKSAAGQLTDSNLTFQGNDVQLENLRNVLFRNCALTLPQNATGANGIDLMTNGKAVSARFQDCQFLTTGDPRKGNLIRSEPRGPAKQARADFSNCGYGPAFAKDSTIHVAILTVPGNYTFLKTDFGTHTFADLVKFPKGHGEIIDQGAKWRVRIF